MLKKQDMHFSYCTISIHNDLPQSVLTWEFGPELPAPPGHARLDLLEHLIADAEELVLARPQLVDEAGAPLRVLPAVEGVQLGGHGVQVQVGEVEAGDEGLVRPLRAVQQLPEVVHLGAGERIRETFDDCPLRRNKKMGGIKNSKR